MSKNHYTERRKAVRDLVHGYINLTAFETELVDTRYFQRLRDIRQVTVSPVFPNANHSRFEHSLGVFELTRQALDAVNLNGLFIDQASENGVDPGLALSTLTAALLHDIGHSPFSHLGEKQFDGAAVAARLMDDMLAMPDVFDEGLARELARSGAVHEKLSCLVIIEKLWERLKGHGYTDGDRIVRLNLGHICRCVLGVRYRSARELTHGERNGESLLTANFCVSLVNWSVFDMDSLDYVMRDSLFCGLGGTRIDTERLFSSIYISEHGTPAFKRPAIPALKTVIDEKNNEFLYAINHHAILYSNFMYEYIFRRFRRDGLYDMDSFFSCQAVVDLQVSDCEVMAMLKNKYREFEQVIASGRFGSSQEEKRVRLSYGLLKRLFSRDFLKPFWKDAAEFSAYRDRRFGGKEDLFDSICRMTCDGPLAGEFRAEAVKQTIGIVNRAHMENPRAMPRGLDGSDLFLVGVRQKWLERANVAALSVYTRRNEARNAAEPCGTMAYEWVPAPLGDLLPLSQYSEHYPPMGFYIYVKPIDTDDRETERAYYDNLELIITAVLSSLAGNMEDALTTSPKERERRQDALWDTVRVDLGM